MSDSYPCSVILAAHGSEASENDNRSLFQMAEQVAQSGIFSKVTPAFLKGQPLIASVFTAAELPVGDVIVIPVMTSEGYYTKNVFPQQLKQNKNFDDYRVLMAPALGVHLDIARCVADRVATMIGLCQLKEHETTVVVVGHGTQRHADSGSATIELVGQLRERLPQLDFQVAFLDQCPTADEVAAQIDTPNTIVIPFLISRGPHATIDIPTAFGLPTGQDIDFPIVEDSTNGGFIICDLPVGLYPMMANICLELAADQLLNIKG